MPSTQKVPEQVPLPKTAAGCRHLMEVIGCDCQVYLALLKDHLALLERQEQAK